MTTASFAEEMARRGVPMSEDEPQRLLSELRTLGLARREPLRVGRSLTFRWWFGADEDRTTSIGTKTRPRATLITLASIIRALELPCDVDEVAEASGLSRISARRCVSTLRSEKLVRVVEYQRREVGPWTSIFQWGPGKPEPGRPSRSEMLRAKAIRYRERTAARRNAPRLLSSLVERGSIFGLAREMAKEAANA